MCTSSRKSDTTASPEVLVGTMTKFMLALDLNSSAVRCCVDPAVMVPTLSLPGCSRAAFTQSASVLYGDVALTMNKQSNVPISEIGAKSFTGSNGGLLNSDALMAVPLVVSATV